MKRLGVLLSLLFLLAGCSALPGEGIPSPGPALSTEISTEISAEAPASAQGAEATPGQIPEYSGSPYVVLSDNVPDFSPEEFTTESYEFYTDLDQLGRCGICYANIGPDLMPTEERESISSVHPSGWVQAQYDCVEGKNLYNRCHLIGFQLTGENANDHNLITGTRYLNVEGMLPFENQVAEYIRSTGNHVLYRVTPDFQGSNLVASGVQIEAASVEDDTIRLNVYCYNVQPGVTINYETGESALSEEALTSQPSQEADTEVGTYVLNTSTRRFHLPTCSSVSTIQEKNRQDYTGSRAALVAEDYIPCGNCNP